MNLRIATWNIHQWADGVGKRNYSRVKSLIAETCPDILALNEIPINSQYVETLANELGYHYFYQPAKYLGNALLSKQTPVNCETIRLDVGPAVEARNCVYLTLNLPIGEVAVFATHLDHIYETTRITQWNVLSRAIEKKQLPLHVVCGDLNALTLNDYNEKQLELIRTMRATSRWEEPTGQLLELISQQGYRDAFEATQQTELQTCWAHTRIDYVLLSKPLANIVQLLTYQTFDRGASDHHLVVVDVGC